MVSPFLFYLLRRGWQDRAALVAARRDPINRHDWVATGHAQLIRSNGFRPAPRFREIKLGTMSLEESSVGTQAMFVRLTQHRPCKRRIVRMPQKIRPAKLIVATHQLKRNQMSIEQRVQVTAQQNTVADNLRLGTRVVLDMRGLESFIHIAARDGTSTGISLKS